MPKNRITQRGDSIALNTTLPDDYTPIDGVFNSNNKIDGSTGEVMWETLTMTDRHRNNFPGLNKVSIIPGRQEIEIHISGKILGTDYFDGITINNVHRILDTVNEATFTKGNITFDSFLNDSNVRRFDNTFNLRVDQKGKISDYVEALEFGLVHKCKVGSKEFGKQSIVLTKNTLKNQRMIFYDKLEELKKPEYKIYKNHLQIWKTDYENVLRVELNCRNREQMRRLWNISGTSGRVSLNDILSSKENALYNQFKSFVDIKTTQKCLFNIDQMTDMESTASQLKGRRRFDSYIFADYVRLQLDNFNGDSDKLLKVLCKKMDLTRLNPNQKQVFETAVKEWNAKKKGIQSVVNGEMKSMFEEVKIKIEEQSQVK